MGGVSISETPETRGECIDRLQKLLKDDPSFKGTLDERVLVMFLRSRWSDVESTFRVVKNYFRARRDMPDYFKNLTPSNIPYKAVCTQHKLMMDFQRKRSFGTISAWRPSMCSLTDLTRCLIVLTESHLTVEETQMGGFVSVFDVEGLSLYHMAHLTPRYFLRILHVLQDCLPLRTEKIYVVNNPPIFALLYAAAKPFLHKKLLSRGGCSNAGVKSSTSTCKKKESAHHHAILSLFKNASRLIRTLN
ncbi:hypothetical protein MTO96_014920 [Rhipicephalus appendiculatus]